MPRRHLAVAAVGLVGFWLSLPASVKADEADGFTCRVRPLRESEGVVDQLVNTAIQQAVDRANRRQVCDADCLFDELRKQVGATYRHRLTGIPHARIAKQASDHPDVDRCHLKFRESIYGARAYNQPWLYPFNGRIIFLADSIRLSGHLVGTDKINHFIREGLAHWRAVDRDEGDIAAVLRREMGGPGRELRMTEHGLKGLSLTGVVAYSDLAAGYSGFTFWSDLLSIGGAESYVAHGDDGRYIQRRVFRFATYVNDAWDEGINCSTFDATLGRHVAAALRARSTTCPVSDCAALTRLPNADLYVNPACFRS